MKLGKYVRFDPGSEAFRRWLARHFVGADFNSGQETEVGLSS